MDIVDVVELLYPGEFEKGNVAFEYIKENRIVISKWSIKGVPELVVEMLEAKTLELKQEWDSLFPKLVYSIIDEQLLLLYNDQKNGTKTFSEAIDKYSADIEARNPK